MGQYIGLKDKNGKELYEGDIIQYEDTSESCSENGTEYNDFINTGIVTYDDKYARFDVTNRECIDTEDVWYEFEIIGNVYENYNLLEESKS